MARVRAAAAAVAMAAAAFATTASSAAAMCTPHTVGGSVVVEAEAGANIGGGWVAKYAAGARGIVWKPWKGDRSVDGPGQGFRSYTVRITEGGYYRLLLRASGEAVRDYNEYVEGRWPARGPNDWGGGGCGTVRVGKS